MYFLYSFQFALFMSGIGSDRSSSTWVLLTKHIFARDCSKPCLLQLLLGNFANLPGSDYYYAFLIYKFSVECYFLNIYNCPSIELARSSYSFKHCLEHIHQPENSCSSIFPTFISLNTAALQYLSKHIVLSLNYQVYIFLLFSAISES